MIIPINEIKHLDLNTIALNHLKEITQLKINFEISLEEIEELVIDKLEDLSQYQLYITLENYCSIVRGTRDNPNILFSSINNISAYLYFHKQNKKILIYW